MEITLLERITYRIQDVTDHPALLAADLGLLALGVAVVLFLVSLVVKSSEEQGAWSPRVLARRTGYLGLLLVAFAVAFQPGFIRARGQGQLTACKSNLKNLGTALEMYSTDFSGRYPARLGLLTPNYLKTIPTCSASGTDTYSEHFRSASEPDLFTVVCSGGNHRRAGVVGDFPQYNSRTGIVERPD